MVQASRKNTETITVAYKLIQKSNKGMVKLFFVNLEDGLMYSLLIKNSKVDVSWNGEVATLPATDMKRAKRV